MISAWVKAIASPLKTDVERADEATRHKAIVKAVYERNADDIYHFLLTMSDEALAQDVSQHIWLKLLEKPEIVKRSSNLRCYLFSVARNAVIDEFRKQGKHVELNDTHISDVSEFNSPQEMLVSNQLDDVFNKALMDLPFLQREAFCLQQEGLSLVDIAEVTGSQMETIKTRLRYAKQALRVKLKQLKRASDND